MNFNIGVANVPENHVIGSKFSPPPPHIHLPLPPSPQTMNTDWSLKLKTIIVTLYFTPVAWAPLLFYFWGLIYDLQYIFSSLSLTVLMAFKCFLFFFLFFFSFFFNDLMAMCFHYNITPESNIKVIRIKEMTMH